MGLGTRFDPGVIGTPLSVVGGLLDELVGALAVRVESHLLIHTHIVNYTLRSQLGQYPYRAPA